MLNDRIAALIARHLSGEATSDELRELAEHFQIFPADQYFEELLRSYWNSKPDIPEQQSLHSNEHFKHILELADEGTQWKDPEIEISQPFHGSKKITTFIKRFSIAAAIAGISFVTWKFAFPHHEVTPKQELQNEMIAKKGARSEFLLPDGSHVRLNSDSRLVYHNNFNDSLREVVLEGEAYFDVVKDPKRPFIVRTSGIDIRVVGTAFNVKSYSEEPTIETTLIHGTIEVVKKNQPDSPMVILHPHEKFVFDKAEDRLVNDNVAIPKMNVIKTNAATPIITLPKNIPDTSIIETSWVYNKFRFDEERFDELAIRMERWFNVKISIKNDEIANRRLHGSFTVETIEEALKALQLSVPFSYKKIGEEVEIYKK